MGMLLRRHNIAENIVKSSEKPLVQEIVPEVVTPTIENDVSKTYTKTEINRMSTSELQALATDNGIENANEISGSVLKKVLVDKLVK